ncbi:unnamed protein product [Cochlearia groenlandica]
MVLVSDLPLDLLGEILSRVPLTSLKAVRSTCKKWNVSSRTQILGQKTSARKQFLGFIVDGFDLCSLKFNLRGILREEGDSWVCPSIEKISNLDKFKISKVLHCDGLLLCVIKNNKKLLVWNPYLDHIQKIRPGKVFKTNVVYGFGYENCGNHKILSFWYGNKTGGENIPSWFELYDVESSLWKSLEIKQEFVSVSSHRGVSLKGNSYFVALERALDVNEYFLLCFDFTTERFSPRLNLPMQASSQLENDIVILSCVREEQLVVLRQHNEIMEIWITTKIDPGEVLWSKFLRIEMALLDYCPDYFVEDFEAGSFFVDEEKKVVVVSNIYEASSVYESAYIIGEDGYFKSVNIEKGWELGYYHSLVFCSYVPSLVPLEIIKQRSKRSKRKQRDYSIEK